MDPRAILEPLFHRAKDSDEFEFCCTLLRIRGLEEAGWDPLVESYALTQQIIGLLESRIDQQLRLRLLLFLYCHVTEMDDLFNIVANLLQVTIGRRSSMTPFHGLPPPPKPPPGHALNRRAEQLRALATEAHFEEVGALFAFFFVRPVRNAFYHSDYILTAAHFNIRWGEGLNLDGIIDRAISLDWLVPKLELGINSFIAMIELVREHRGTYVADKVVRGRINADGSSADIQLLGRPDGLVGFKSPPDPGFSPPRETATQPPLAPDGTQALGGR